MTSRLRRTMFLVSVVMVLLVCMTLSMLPGPTAAGPAPRPGGHLRYGLDTDPPNIDPHVATGAASRNVILQLYNSLLRYGPGGSLLPDLAERWENPDAKTYIFHIRRGVRFHNDTPLGAADVKASIERIANPKTGALIRDSLTPSIAGIEVTGSHTVKITLTEPQASFPALLARAESAIVSKALAEAGHDFRTTPVGTGPFMFAEREPGVRIRVVKNPNYFEKGIPYLDSITFLPLRDDATRVNALRSGAVDMIGYVPWKDMAILERDPQLQLWGTPGPFMVLMFNVNRKPFDDRRVRQAIAYAVNRQAIVDVVFFGRGSPITGGLIPTGTWAHNADLEGTYKYDPERAKKLLAEAGYNPATPVRLMQSAVHAMHYQTGEVVQAELRKIGMNVVLDSVEWPVAVERGFRGDYDFRVHGLLSNIIDPDFYAYYFASHSAFYAKPVGFRNDTLDRLLKEGRASIDQAHRKRIYRQFEERLLALSPWTFLTLRVQGDAASKAVKGYQHLPGGLVTDSQVFLRYIWFER
ncbi:MAG: ABC transporter substrate-binding protein [bacterium]|nr:ABC transporter substrate-binding protein [bacterium]